jgi:hypothetical protein
MVVPPPAVCLRAKDIGQSRKLQKLTCGSWLRIPKKNVLALSAESIIIDMIDLHV